MSTECEHEVGGRGATGPVARSVPGRLSVLAHSHPVAASRERGRRLLRLPVDRRAVPRHRRWGRGRPRPLVSDPDGGHVRGPSGGLEHACASAGRTGRAPEPRLAVFRSARPRPSGPLHRQPCSMDAWTCGADGSATSTPATRPPLLRRRDRWRSQSLGATGTLLGVDREPAYGEVELPVSAGDRLVLVTDGFLEARNPTDEPFGAERLGGRCRRLRQLIDSAVRRRRRARCRRVQRGTAARGRPDRHGGRLPVDGLAAAPARDGPLADAGQSENAGDNLNEGPGDDLSVSR